MKGTQAAEVRAAFFQLHIATNHVDDVDAIEQILNEALRDHATASDKCLR